MFATRLSILVAVALFAIDAASAPLFRQPLPIDLNWVWGSTLGPLVTSDFDGDGFPDIAYAHGDGRLVVALSAAGGPFAPSKISTVPNFISAMAAGDLDGDSDSDLVYLRGFELRVFRGNGDGTFVTEAGTIVSTLGPIALGDVNGDGKLDVVAAAVGQSLQISVHLGNGNGGFASGVTTPSGAGNFASTIALADLNGDGRADVVTGGSHTTVYLSGASGTLQSGWSTFGGSFALGHLNGDGLLDLMIRRTDIDPPTLNTFLGAGDGTFVSGNSQPTMLGTKIDYRDFDGDNINDIVSVGVTAVGGLAVARGLGNGAFAEPLITTSASPGNFVTGDFDRDGKRDVAHVSGQVASLNLIRGNGDGTFRADRGYLTGSAGGQHVGLSALDMDGDEHPDATTLLASGAGTWSISVLRNDGTGHLLSPTLTSTTLSESASAFLVGSLDGNSWPDAVVITDAGGVRTATSFLNDGDATFTQSSSITLTTANGSSLQVKLVDVTGDGAIDLLVNGDFYEGNGDGSFDPARTIGVNFDVAGDLDGNGTIDVIGRGSRLEIALNDGSGNFSAPTSFGAGFEVPNLLADFDGDDILDLFCITDRGTRVFVGRGDGTFEDPIDVAFSDRSWTLGTTADFDGDGDLDVATGSDVLFGNGDGRFRAFEFVGTTSGPPAIADFDGDGRPDILSSLFKMVVVHLSGSIVAPTRTSTITLGANTPSQYAIPTSYHAEVKGNTTPVLDSVVLYTIDNVPIALSHLALNMSVPPETAASASPLLTLPVGTHTVTATYLGSETFLPSSASTTVTIERASTTLTKTAVSEVFYGSAFSIGWTLTAPVVPDLPGPTTSAMTLTEGGVPLSDLQWLDGSVVVRGLEVGTHSLTLEFEGDANYESSSTTLTITVDKRDPAITWSFAPLGTARVAGPVMIAVTFVEQDYGSTTGAVVFSLNGSSIGTFPITASRAEVTVTLAAGIYDVAMSYAGDAGNHAIARTSSFYVYGPAGVPTAMVATSVGGIVTLRWTPTADAVSYKLYHRGTYASAWSMLGTASFPGGSVSLPSGQTRMYGVAVVDQSGSTGPIGPPDIATNVAFTDDPVIPGTPIRAAHLTQLRTAVNAVRTFAGLTTFPFTDATVLGTKVRAIHFTELRDALTQARNAIGMPIAFSPQAPAIGITIRSYHIEELRAGVR